MAKGIEHTTIYGYIKDADGAAEVDENAKYCTHEYIGYGTTTIRS